MPRQTNKTSARDYRHDEQLTLLSTKIDAALYEKILAQNNFSGRTVGKILAAIAHLVDGTVEKGLKFETLTQWALPLIKSVEIEYVKNPRGKDIGVDLIATDTSGNDIAIQCKFYNAQAIGRNEMLAFVAGAEQKNIKTKWLVCGGKGGISDTAHQFADSKKIKIIDLRQYYDTVLTTKPVPVRAPLPLQQEAIDAVLQGFSTGDERGKLIMACGSGKTFTALRIAENLTPNTATHAANLLFIAPSIALVAQARNEWLTHSIRRLRTLVICSDQTTTHNEDIQPNEIAGQVTTDPQEIAAVLTEEIAKGDARATFCTYQSLDKLLTAQTDHGAPRFDLAIVDEAHRTTGLLDEAKTGQFQMIHDATKIKVAKRLYMTATPRIYKESNSVRDTDAVIVDMNDTDYYGTEFYRLTFKKAVEADMLCDYRVIALGVSEEIVGAGLMATLIALNDEIETTKSSGRGRAADDQSVLALGAISLAVNGFVKGEHTPGVIARSIAFANNIRRSKWLALALANPQMKGWVTKTARREQADANKSLEIKAQHLDGTSTSLQRHTALQTLRDRGNAQEPHLISNAKLFTEGVDIPALNAIAFLDPRQSKVDTVQAVGRVMRKSPGKTFGYIIVPVIMPPGVNLLDTLDQDKSRFQSLGNVLRALQSHDERLYTELPSHLILGEVKPREPRIPRDDEDLPIQQTLLDDAAKQALFAQIAKHTGLSRPGKQIADAITQAIERAARILEQEGGAKIIADAIGTPTDNAKESCKTAALLIVNACIMHKRLEETGNLGGLTKIGFANNSENPLSVLHAAWRTILEKDYSPIFEDAALLLNKLQPHKRMHQAIRVLMQCAIENATTLNDLGFDHAGPLYHRVLGTATSDGAFFTKNLSAYLLAGLAFDDTFVDWTDPAAVRRLRVADPACGTGTLLMAALNTIKRKAAAAQNLTAEQTEDLHKHLVENAIYGFDINKYSIQLAACNLTIGAPNTDYRGMNLHTLQHGPLPGTDGDKPQLVRHGALEILLGKMDAELLQMTFVYEQEAIYGTDAERKRKAFRAPDNLDAVIYNPPFTDTQLQGGRFNSAVKRAMDKRLEQIRKNLVEKDRDARKIIGQRSIGPYFTPMTNRLLSPQKGTLAKIIPATACTSENGRAERQYIAANFQIDIVVTSHDPKHVNFSENTSVHECLLVGRRSLGRRKPTRFIQLAAYPANVKAAEELVTAIQSGEASDLFTETLWSADKVRDGNWSPVQWMNPQLAEVADQLNALPKTVQTQHPWTPDCVSFRLAFTYEPSDDGDAFCTIAENLMQTMQATPTHKATARPKKERQAKTMWGRADHALVTSRFSTTSSRLTAIYSEQPALGSAFRPIGIGDRETAKAMVAFLNSSFGVIQMLNRRGKKLTYPTYSSPQMRTLRLPDPVAVDLSPLLDAFEKVKDTPLQRLSAADTDPARRILDHAAAACLGIPAATTDQWRQWLAREPTITNQKWQPE